MPYPIIFGHERPQLRMRTIYGKQCLYSISNQNLYVKESTLNEEGDLPISRLFDEERSSGYTGTTPSFAEDEGLTVPYCYPWECGVLCPLFFENYEEMRFDDHESDTQNTELVRLSLNAVPQLDKCRVLSSLLDCLTTPAERKLAEIYYKCAICGVKSEAGSLRYECKNLREKWEDYLKSWQTRQLRSPRQKYFIEPRSAIPDMVDSLAAPALIPQVWLNYTYDPKRRPTKMSGDANDMPKRVDFLFIRNKKMSVVEIDDPSHYADYDAGKRKYEVNEERYTNNLRVERALRNQGFEIFRLSNFEVMNATESDLIQLISQVLKIPIMYIGYHRTAKLK
jgi:hypothetical protein